MEDKTVYQLSFDNIYGLEQVAKVLKKAWDLDREIIKNNLIANDIKFSEIMEGVYMLDYNQPNLNIEKATAILGDRSVFEASLIRMGVKTIKDEGNT